MPDILIRLNWVSWSVEAFYYFNKRPNVKRFGMMTELLPDKAAEYKKLHQAVWPEVLKVLKDCNVQNYTIYLRVMDDARPFLFAYLEYTGADFETDMARLSSHEATQRWWAVCKPLQNPSASRGPNEWWTYLEQVFHLD